MGRGIYEVETVDEKRVSAFRAWSKLRVANIRANVSAADVLGRNGVSLRRSGLQTEHISCPFHGTDENPSAKYFPNEGDSPSHVWCFVCRENWDVIALWKKFSGTERFGEILQQLEREFGLTAPEPPLTMDQEDRAPRHDPLAEDVRQLFEVCESRLREYRESFDMTRHLKLGSILDHTRFYLEQGQIDYATAKARLLEIAKRALPERTRAEASTDP